MAKRRGKTMTQLHQFRPPLTNEQKKMIAEEREPKKPTIADKIAPLKAEYTAFHFTLDSLVESFNDVMGLDYEISFSFDQGGTLPRIHVTDRGGYTSATAFDVDGYRVTLHWNAGRDGDTCENIQEMIATWLKTEVAE